MNGEEERDCNQREGAKRYDMRVMMRKIPKCSELTGKRRGRFKANNRKEESDMGVQYITKEQK